MTNVKPTSYSNLSETEKDKIKCLLYVMDSFGISDEAYHELSLQNGSLARSHLIKQCRTEMSNIFSISKTPGSSQGAQLKLHETLNRLLREVNIAHALTVDGLPVVQLKFAADGAKVSRLSSFLVLSLAVLNKGQEVMSCTGQYTLAIVSAKENFDNIKESFSDIFGDINDLLGSKDRNGYIKFVSDEGREYFLEIFLGGDMKFLLTAMGLNAANAKFSCIYCKIDKNDRWDVSKPENFYASDKNKRTVEEMKRMSQSKSKFGCVRPPLLDIDLDHVVIDELHLMMRITDVLLRNLIEDAVNLDQESNLGKKGCSRTGNKVNSLISCIESCGVTFQIWENKVKDGRGDSIKNLEWTSLNGTDCKKLLRSLPDKLLSSECIHEGSKSQVVKLWQDFRSLYSSLNSWSPDKITINLFFSKAKAWIQDFVSLSSSLEGYDSKNVTPYMHILVYHVPHLLQKYGSIKQFTGQGVEKCNDDIKLIYHRKTNKHDATAEALRNRCRKHLLRSCARIKRKYTKQNAKYWQSGKKLAFSKYKVKVLRGNS
ncbi:hypothetical protein FSP39_006271 [Pinctada imbricata]|uniref:Uncharacterized protein n=1 Tax=Pinctada imbricata TaxID=66713 RepID=A0AA89BUJ4_PINIB|nr:hypothetical protein FSP39_006271 [Pinctada imbricata]